MFVDNLFVDIGNLFLFLENKVRQFFIFVVLFDLFLDCGFELVLYVF